MCLTLPWAGANRKGIADGVMPKKSQTMKQSRMSGVRRKGVLGEAACVRRHWFARKPRRAYSETVRWLVRPGHRGLVCGRRKGAGYEDRRGRAISSSGPPSLQVVHRTGRGTNEVPGT